jgi:WD40 repeat protein
MYLGLIVKGTVRKTLELKGHSSAVDQVCWDPTNGEQLATASSDKTVRIWYVVFCSLSSLLCCMHVCMYILTSVLLVFVVLLPSCLSLLYYFRLACLCCITSVFVVLLPSCLSLLYYFRLCCITSVLLVFVVLFPSCLYLYTYFPLACLLACYFVLPRYCFVFDGVGTLAVGSNQCLVMVMVLVGRGVHTLKTPGENINLAWNPLGHMMAVGDKVYCNFIQYNAYHIIPT